MKDHGRKASADRAREVAEARYDGVLEHAPCGIVLADREGQIVSVNGQAERDFGYDRSELVGQSVELLVPERLRRIHAAQRATFALHAHRAMGAGRRLLARRKDGSEFPVEIGLGPVDDHLLAAFIVNIAEPERTAESLRRSEARYRSLLENANDAVVVLDEAGCVTECNLRAPRLFGAAREVIVNRPLEQFVEASARDAWRARLDRVFNEGSPCCVELPLVRADGVGAHADVSASLVRLGEDRLVLALLHDVTARNEMQRQLLITERLASLGMLAAGIAHEINNPLAAVILILEHVAQQLVEAGGGAGAFAHLEDQLRDALVAADRARAIVRDLRLFVHPEEDCRGAVDIRAVLDSSIRLAWSEIHPRARISKVYNDVPPVLANASRLGQVFLNVLVNAAQAIEGGHAESNEIRVSTQLDPSGRVAVAISDTGSGMTDAVMKKLFSPFFTTKPAGAGTGLGLSICHRIITALGGEISAESRAGGGTTFRVVLPTADPVQLLPRDRPDAGANTRQGRVLIVDDEAMLGSALARVLAEQYDVASVTSGEAALRRFRRGERFDVILCDMMMPEMDGVALYGVVRSIAPDQAERMIFLTGGVFTNAARTFLAAVHNTCIDKPIDTEKLRSLIAERTRREVQRDTAPGRNDLAAAADDDAR